MQHGRTFTRFGSAAVALAGLAGLLVGCSGSSSDADRAPSDGDESTTTSASAPGTTAPDVDRVLSVDGTALVATLDPRFQSYNIEMVEVTGGNFWAPYDTPEGGKVARPPIELSSPRLRNLARGLRPAYIRVSGTWANGTYFDVDGTTGGVPPEGFQGVLTAEQWQGVGDFANAVDGEVVTSFASTSGVRDADGVWQPDQARALLEFSKEHDVPVTAAEFYNEPSLNIGVPDGYDIPAIARDFKIFKAMAADVMPDMKIVGPGVTGDVLQMVIKTPILAEPLLKALGPGFDAFSYHYYPKVSSRCGSEEGRETALTQGFLGRIEATKSFYEKLRDRYEPEAPMWITETAQAACGGDRWAAQYVDVIRYVDELGRLATGDGDVVFHNTLAASDYGLLDEDGFTTRPNYWAAVLWHQLMGPKVLAVPGDDPDDLAVYAHCTPGAATPSATYAVVNSSATEARTVAPADGESTVYQLTGPSLDAETIDLNGTELQAAEDGTVPKLTGKTATGAVTVPPTSVTFVVAPTDARACA